MAGMPCKIRVVPGIGACLVIAKVPRLPAVSAAGLRFMCQQLLSYPAEIGQNPST